MPTVATIRKVYRKYIHLPWLDRLIYAVLDTITNIYCKAKRYYFPKNYIRRWKLNMLWELYEPETVALFKKIIKPGMVVVDVGAHIGYFSRIFSALVGQSGKVICFEADPENFQILKKNTSHLKNVQINEAALTNQVGTIDFYHTFEKAGTHSILPNIPLDYKKEKITVRAQDLDSFVEEKNINRIDVVKMDIEGGEGAALNGMKETLANMSVKAMVIEFAPAWIKAAGEDPLEFLRNFTNERYKLFVITESELIPLDTTSDAAYKHYLPKTPTAFNEFFNLYCLRD